MVEPKNTTEPKIGRRKDLSLAASKGDTGYLSQSNVSQNCKMREGLSEEYLSIHEGASAEN